MQFQVYVLKAKFNQDPLERFFGKARQAACDNDHPDVPTFLQLYRTLSVYSLLKPPKFGSCEVIGEKSALDLPEFRKIFQKAGTDPSHLEQLKAKLDGLIKTGDWDGTVEDNETTAEVADAVLYYITGFLSRRMKTMLPCELCRQSLSSVAPKLPQASLTLHKSRGGLTHPNTWLRCAEDFFSKNMNDCDVFWGTVDHVLKNFDLTFPCREHKNDAVAKILYYVGMRMRPHCASEARNKKKSCQQKMSRLAND